MHYKAKMLNIEALYAENIHYDPACQSQVDNLYGNSELGGLEKG